MVVVANDGDQGGGVRGADASVLPSLLFVVGLVAYGVPAGAVPLPIRPIAAVADDYPDGSACSSRIAIDATFYVACTDFCVTDAQCPADWGCKPVTQGNGEDVWLCFPRRIVR